MQVSDIDKALLIVGDTNSKLINPKDESMVLLTGDAGSAILLEKRVECTFRQNWLVMVKNIKL